MVKMVRTGACSANSALDLSKLIAAGFTPRDHRDALAEYLGTL